jgi:ABC-type nitrate/sulfonate/bicarbonate transport system substrate-binding protein
VTVRSKARVAAIAAVVAAVALTSACSSSKSKTTAGSTGSGASGGSLATVQVMMFPGQAYRLPVLVAEQQGFFTKHGLKVKVVAQPNNLQGAQAQVSTHSQIGQLSTPTLAQGVENGAGVAAFCGGIKYLQTSLIAKNGSSFTAGTGDDVLKQLNGKKVGVQTPIGSGLQLLFAAALKAEGVTNVTYVNVGGGNNVTLAALNKGSVDVAQVNPPATQAIEQGNEAKVLTYLPASGGPDAYQLYGSAWTGLTSWLKDSPQQAKGFCDAMSDALTWITNSANTSAAASILASDTGVSESLATSVVTSVFTDFSTQLPQDVLSKTLQFYSQIGITKTDLSTQLSKLVQPVS